MSQNSLALPTSGTLSGLAAVQGINAAIDTLNTLASGASAPSSPEAGQLWHNTSTNTLNIRSLDNTTWIAIGTLNESGYTFNATSAATLSAALGIALGGTGATTAAAALTNLLGSSVIPAANGGTGKTSVAALWTSSLTQNGYEVSPSGVIRQWGVTGTIGGGGNGTLVTYPLTFPAAVFSVTASLQVAAGSTNSCSLLNVSGTTGFDVYNNSNNNGTIFWQAVGH
jgi:hypothetical protein